MKVKVKVRVRVKVRVKVKVEKCGRGGGRTGQFDGDEKCRMAWS
jgi:hypothetical protein